ncbi:putative PaaX family transcriptional regulator [Paenibacillus mucilaginosus 3016]|uniref:PaaX family transcripitonal regulator n=2 Tax=Paenibacillus mucilaginosus TaxID=61624 RepID=I0BT60_9BACL|nr:PaaX family transcriptional regulator C-terminal domain-containing protein [Paenibacillus mucilaginosus]AFC33244.1 putative PaaX family transcriptional regulator [Paenibacillus mucilaginosus 3016]AFH65557.1 PaaX family transcripitonal regulator [Paenibacillus mucilaginosus K02]WFA21670.1 PaaX family transcriptional regulator [Paenibacillus mucilaginosus]
MLSIEKQILFLLSRSGPMDTQELLRIYERRGYTAPTIRNALSHLKKNGYAVSPARSVYEITETGRTFIRTINRKPQFYDRAWDGSWHLVMVEIPEAERRRRDAFRADIRQTGFGLLYHSVYIAPWNYSEEVQDLLGKHGIGDKARQFHGSMQEPRLSAAEAAEIWELAAAGREYEKMWAWYTSICLPAAGNLLAQGEAADPLDLFTLYLELGEVISGLYLVDPMLPPELLPADWQGRHQLRTMQEGLRQLAEAIPADSPYARFL